MRYFVQLKLLIWKNFILRKRNKLRTAIEFLWPIVIFFFLILLHNLGFRNNVPDCYFKPKAMPSAGELLFLQTIICAFNNTCDKLENSTMEEYDQSLLSHLSLMIKETFELVDGSEAIKKYESDTRTLREVKLVQEDDIALHEKSYLSLNTSKKSDSLHSDIIARSKIVPEDIEQEDLLRNYLVLGLITKDMKNHFTDSRDVVNRCFKGTPFPAVTENNRGNRNKKKRDADKKIALLLKRKNSIIATTVLKSLLHYSGKNPNELTVKSNSTLHFMTFLDFLFCGHRVPPFLNQIRSVASERSFSKKYSLKASIPNYRVKEVSTENDTTDFCNNLMQKLSAKESYKVIFGLLKPFFRGKVLYTPNAPVVNKLMRRVNDTFNRVKHIIDFINDLTVENITDESHIYEIIDKYRQDKQTLKRIVNSDAGREFLKYYGKKAEGDKDDPEVIESDAKALDEILKTSARNLQKSYSNTSQLFDFREVKSYLECIDFNRIIPVPDEDTAVKESLKWLNNDRLAALIVFVNISSDAEYFPPSITYKIRTGIERTPKTTQIRDRVYVSGVKRNVFHDLKHITGGFAFLQNIIETELIREYTGRERAPGIFLQQMPFPCHVHDSFVDVITRTLPVFMVISWSYMFGIIVKKIVAEKENHLKGTMRIYGVYNSQHWIAWFIDAYIPVMIIAFILSIMLIYGNVIPNSDFLLIWLYIMMYGLPTICLAFLVSIFFSKSSFALNVSMVIFFLLYLIYPPIQNYGEAINSNFKLATCIVSNVAFGLGCTWIANMEELGLGAKFNNINHSPIPGNPITMSFIIEMFMCSAVVYLLIAIYLENVYRAEESVRLPWNYIFTSSYWRNAHKKSSSLISHAENCEMDDTNFENEPKGLAVGIETINLTKEYGIGRKKRRVVDNLNMRFYENQITSFLGHNGAGKTTSISMMSGLLPATSGAVMIYGINLEKEPDIAGKDIGICRQENVLLDELTVEEHLWLFSRLKDRSVKETLKDMAKLLKDLQLGHRAKSPVHTLSGGMKRKVCLAMAFIGGPRTIFLDEPTAGVDPFSRRSIWDLLIQYKKGRTLILTTHFLDEADLLGDRIAILGNGKLKCCGSSVFLKNNFGRGYYLTIENRFRSVKSGRAVCDQESGGNEMLSPQATGLNKLITGIISDAQFLEEIGSEITFILPLQTEPSTYDKLFTVLENNKTELNIVSYGISNSSLVEVFFTITQQMDRDCDKSESKNNTGYFQVKDAESPPSRSTGYFNASKIMESDITERALDTKICKIITQQFFALLIKRFHHHRRNYKLLIIEVFLPALFITIALLLVLTLPSIEKMPPLIIDVSAYSPSLIFYSKNIDDPLVASYEKSLLGPIGLGTKCVVSPKKCNLKTIPDNTLTGKKKADVIKNCTCKEGNYICRDDHSFMEPPNAKMSSGDQLYNLTSLDLMNWLITSEFNLSSVRYGGAEFGYFNAWSGVAVKEFLNLFMVKKFVSLMTSMPRMQGTKFDVEILTNFLISFTCDKAYGDELFKSKNFSDNIIVWYNNRGWIAGLAFMNGITNLVLRASLPPEEDPSQYSITLVNHPLPITERQLEDDIEVQINTSLLTAIAIIWALSFIPAMFAIYIVEERMSGLKHLQIVSGISKSVYWIVALLWDMCLYSLNVLTILILFLAFDIQTYINEESFGVFVLLLYSYGFANITFVYAVSYMFITPSIAFVFVACYNIFVGMVTLWTTFFLDMISNNEDPLYLKKIFLVFPPYCFGRALVKMALAYNSVQTMKTFGINSYIDYSSWSISSKYVVFMNCLGLLFFATTVMIQFRCLPQYFKRGYTTKNSVVRKSGEEEDVKREKERVESNMTLKGEDVLVVHNLTKVYFNSTVPAVDCISFGVKSGECFGLLGLNGAGKTTVFKMLTGYLPISEGDALIGGYSLRKNIRKARLLTGYCPQGDALDPYLTCEEHLSLFCRIRGVTGEKRSEMIDRNIKRLGLSEYRHKIVKVLSGGNKRKLSTAIALMGDPEIVLLDEPTSGMDSHSRRFVWKCIQRIVNEGRCVVLTSHNMEECQALCTKLSIMVSGKLMCFGSCQHLKSKFDEGYSVRIRIINMESATSVKLYIEENLPQCTLIQIQYLEMTFRLHSTALLGLAFKVLHQAKQDKLIQDYSLSQTTLENVFLKLAETDGSAVEHFKCPIICTDLCKVFSCIFKQ